MVLQESGEMYLESILVLIRQGKAACRMEHVISDATFQALKRHLASPQ